MLGNPNWFKRRKYTGWGLTPEVSSPFFEQIIIERKSKKEVTSMSEHDLIGFLRFNRQG